jgi:CRISPR/Cas system endoribonuclease Cas6 (RAMP superfamily)
MNKYGVDSFIYSKLNEKKDEIMKSMLDYYESTEEFEKCSFIVDFFNKIKEVELENKS